MPIDLPPWVSTYARAVAPWLLCWVILFAWWTLRPQRLVPLAAQLAVAGLVALRAVLEYGRKITNFSAYPLLNPRYPIENKGRFLTGDPPAIVTFVGWIVHALLLLAILIWGIRIFRRSGRRARLLAASVLLVGIFGLAGWIVVGRDVYLWKVTYTLPWPSQAECPVHHVPLESERIEALPTRLLSSSSGSREYDEAQHRLFPLANNRMPSVGGDPRVGWILRRYCPHCRDAQRTWLDERAKKARSRFRRGKHGPGRPRRATK